MAYGAVTWAFKDLVTSAKLAQMQENVRVHDHVTADQGAPLGQWSSYTPGWGSSGTNPTIGSGSIVGRFTRLGSRVTFLATIVTASDTNAGTGSYFVTLPVVAVNVAGLNQPVVLHYASTVELSGTGRITAGSDRVGVFSVNDAVWSAGTPAMPAGTLITISGTYFAA